MGGVNDDNEVFLFLGTSFERIGLSAKHFTVGPAGELGANSSNNVFKFVDGSFKLIPGKKCCGMLPMQCVFLPVWQSG